jgi:MarR family transcriptional regulator, lower aerobic nicotinate degradation pathway regulator
VPAPPLRVRRWPTFALGRLYRAAHARISADLAEVDETLSTYYVLATLFEYGELSQQQVCDRIDMDRSDMVRLIDDLEGRGHVVRARDSQDRRRYRLNLTRGGRTALRRCEEILAAATDDVFAHLSADERRVLHQLTVRALGEPDDGLDLPDSPTAPRAITT